MTRDVIPGILVAVILALALRCPELGRRPMHNDEAVNAVKFGRAIETGAYRYDPNEHHGPALFYATRAWLTLGGDGSFAKLSEGRLRAVAVCFGVGLILLLPLTADGIGRPAMLWTGVFTAISPAMVYYSRDYIHEMLLVFFTFAAISCGWRYWRSGRIGWAVCTGAALGLMQAAKETFVLPVVAAIGALAINAAWSRWAEPGSLRPGGRLCRGHMLAGFVTWMLVVALFFTSLFTNAAGVVDAVRTYAPWIQRAAGDSPHVHSWYFYLARLAWFHVRGGPIWSEGLILVLAVIGGWLALSRNGPRGSDPVFLRFIALYALLLATFYSAIVYKTPWCLLGFWQAFILLAGVGSAAIFERLFRLRTRLLFGCFIAIATGQLAWQAWQSGVTFCADRRNPYVYAQTSPNIVELRDELDALASASAADRHVPIEIVAPGDAYWPLPWTLRSFDHVGWWNELPNQPPAPVMIVSTKLDAQLDRAGTHVMTGLYELRPDVFFELYVETNLWRRYVDSLQRKQGPP